MKRWITTIAVMCGATASSAAWAQGGYSVMNTPAPAPAVGTAPTIVAPPAPTGQSPTGPVELITPSHGPAPREGRRGPRSPVIARRPEEYGGVTPGVPGPAPGIRRAQRAGRAPYVAWPGFQMVPGGSRLFLVLTQPEAVTESLRNGRQRVYHIPNTRILLRNNQRPLITEAFETPLSRAYLRPSRGGTDLVVELRADVEPQLTQETSAVGRHLVYLNFPAFAVPEIARIQLPGGSVMSVTAPSPGAQPVAAPGAPPPQVVVGLPSAPPGTDTERPPGVR